MVIVLFFPVQNIFCGCSLVLSFSPISRGQQEFPWEVVETKHSVWFESFILQDLWHIRSIGSERNLFESLYCLFDISRWW